jgi:hypothetical protein
MRQVQVGAGEDEAVGVGDERAGEPGGALVDAGKTKSARIQPLGGAGVGVLDGDPIESAVTVQLANLGAQVNVD